MDESDHNGSRLYCTIDKNEGELFFSLVDYRNNYFTSDNPDKIIEFYNGFENRDQLIQWMKERPKGTYTIHEVEGDKDIIVVITTADFNGKYAKECRENIFKGLHMVFIESGGRNDFYFNYAHNCNIGIRKAIEYNPKWVVVSNDDMYKIDDVKILVSELEKLDNTKIGPVFITPSFYHSYHAVIGFKRKILTFVLYYIFSLYIGKSKTYFKRWKILNHFGVKTFKGIDRAILTNFFLKNPISLTVTSDFTILSSVYFQNNGYATFDETYINGVEDLDLSLKLHTTSIASESVDFKIGDYTASTLHFGDQRVLRESINLIYFDAKRIL